MPTVENSRIGLDDWLKNHIRSKLRKKNQQIQETKWASLCENCADFDSWQLPVVCWTDSFEQLCLQLWLDLLAIAEREVRLNCNGSLVSRQALLLTFSPFNCCQSVHTNAQKARISDQIRAAFNNPTQLKYQKYQNIFCKIVQLKFVATMWA